MNVSARSDVRLIKHWNYMRMSVRDIPAREQERDPVDAIKALLNTCDALPKM